MPLREMKVLTSLPATSIPELLQATTHLLGSAPLPGLLKNPVRDKSISHGEPSEETGFSRVIWLIILETCKREQR